MSSTYEPGDAVTLDWTVSVAGTPTNATVTLTITLPDGTTAAPSPNNPATGSYTANYVATQNGVHTYRWLATGAASAAQSGQFRVGGICSVADVRTRLNKTLIVDDSEIEEMIEAATAEYEEWVGPVDTTVTEVHHGGTTSLILRNPNAASIVSAVYSDGTTIDVDDLDLDTTTGILYWGYNTSGLFTYGSRNVTITYTVGGVPLNHRETVAADVAGYFAATQRGPDAMPGEGYEESWTASPLVLFPRIRTLAVPSIA